MMEELRRDLAEITGMTDVSLMPNSGASGGIYRADGYS